MDAVARLIAPALGAQLGQQVVVENRPGAAGLLAADAVARSPADGYALLLGESISSGQWLTYIPIWLAVMVLIFEGFKHLVRQRRSV